MLGEAVTLGISDSRIRMKRRMTRLVGHAVEHPDEIGQHLHISGAVMEAAPSPCPCAEAIETFRMPGTACC